MTTAPVRGLSKYGIITDVDPYNLPIGAWSAGVNVRFHNGSILRAPVFRSVLGLGASSPRFVTANTPNTGFSSVIIGYLNGSVTSSVNGTETDISAAGYTPVDQELPFTAPHLGDVFYVNRGDRVPWSLRTSDSVFQPLANWNSGWRAKLLRSAGGALCAFGITKDGVEYPTMIKTSEFAIADTVPSTWDETDPTTNATENILAEMISPIMDAAQLGETMIVYGLKETWTMAADGSENIWAYHRLFDDAGAINANCSVEIDRLHYVFGLNDIWRHDGTSKASIANQRVKDFIFANINIRKANRCFVEYNAALKEVYFSFVSGDNFTGFNSNVADGCNRCAVYNIPEDNWSFYDLPYIFGMAEANVDTITTWADAPGTWATAGGTWFDQEDSLKRVTVMVGEAAFDTYGVSKSLYAFDLQGPGSVVAFPVDTNATLGWQLQRDGIDLDDMGVDLKGYKLISAIYPQGRLEAGGVPISFSFGSGDYYTDQVSMSPPQTYDALTTYKLDYNASGRYLFMLMKHDDYHYVNITGFDIDLDVLGER